MVSHPGFAAVQKKKNPALKKVKGGSTSISAGSMKGHALANDHCDNLAAKCEFVGD